MSALDDHPQARLDLKVIREPGPEVADSVVQRQPNFRAALVLMFQSSGLDDAQIAAECDIDAAQFSRIVKGRAHFPDEKLTLAMDVCGNDIPLRWLAFSRGYGLHRLKSAVEHENDQLKAQLAEAELKLSHFKEFQSSARGAA